MAKDADHLKLRAGVKQTLEQAHSALDAYFEFLKKSVSSFMGALASSSPSSRPAIPRGWEARPRGGPNSPEAPIRGRMSLPKRS